MSARSFAFGDVDPCWGPFGSSDHYIVRTHSYLTSHARPLNYAHSHFGPPPTSHGSPVILRTLLDLSTRRSLPTRRINCMIPQGGSNPWPLYHVPLVVPLDHLRRWCSGTAGGTWYRGQGLEPPWGSMQLIRLVGRVCLVERSRKARKITVSSWLVGGGPKWIPTILDPPIKHAIYQKRH